MILKNNYLQVLKVNCQKYVGSAQLGIIIPLCANMKMLHVQIVVVIILMMLVHYNKFKSLDNLKMVNFYLVFSYILNSVYLSILNGLVDYILEFTYLLVLYFFLVFNWYSFLTFFLSYYILMVLNLRSIGIILYLCYALVFIYIIFHIIWYSYIFWYVISFVILFLYIH